MPLTDFSFAQPWWLLTLLALIPIALLRNRSGSRGNITFSSLSLLASLGTTQRDLAGRFSLAFLSLCVIFSAISLARPQKQNSHTERKASGIDIILAMDVSFSMEIADFQYEGRWVQRDKISREVVKEFIKQRPNDRIGLIPFAGQPYQESPITLEHDWLLGKIDSVTPNRDLSQGTAIGSAISASAIRLDKRKDSKSRIIILLTDGSNNSGKLSPIQAAEAAKTLGIKVYTVAIGTEGGRLAGQQNPAQEFDTETLEEIARITDAEYYRAKSANDLVAAFQTIDQLEKTERTQKVVTTYEDFHHIFTALATLSLLGHILILILHRPAGPE
ncbi:VWA domain-containing protein [Rubritalea tangerina]|uniref:VWA domain-containing protein n=2 Tax=Rubritalea tangerina TaxID=430798 RepID=A0ABW4ZDI8_9BACT